MGGLRIGVIGAGLQGRRRARALRSAVDRLVWVSDVDQKTGAHLAEAHGARFVPDWERAVDGADVDVVVIATPSHLHGAMVRRALEVGAHALCEKPLALDLDDAGELVALAASRRRKLKCGFNHRHFPAIAQAKAWCDDGRLGRPLMIRCRHGICGRPGYENDWRAQARFSGGGELMDQGFHAIDLFRWFLGELWEVLAVTATTYWPIAPVEDNAFALLRTADGRMASLHNSWTQWKNLFSFEVMGEEGALEIDGLGGSYGTHTLRFHPRSFEGPFTEQTIEYRGDDRSFDAEWMELVAAIGEDREPLGNGRDGLEALRIVQAIYCAAESSTAVRVA